MSLTPEDRRERRAQFRQMRPTEKLQFIFTYYKLPLLLTAIALFLICSGIYRRATWKEPVLYAGYVNVSMGEALEEELNAGFLAAEGYDARRTQVYLYRALYLSDSAADSDHQYAYASRLKLLASINSKQLDLVLMNREGYDILSKNGYLLSMPEVLAQGDCSKLAPMLTSNEVILEDNQIEYELNEAERYEAITETVTNAIDLSTHPLFTEAGFPDAVYLGVIANTERLPAVTEYLEYLNSFVP